jgi:hypothetical protein
MATAYPSAGGSWCSQATLAQMALPALRALALATQKQDIAGVVEAAQRLAGLGPGLTPSGDDTLAGFAAVIALLGAQLSTDAAPREHIAAAIAATARPRTTMLSATLLAHAAHGEVAEPLGDLLLALVQPGAEHETLFQAAARLLSLGATSGCDALLGVLLGLQALSDETCAENVY